MSTYDPCNKLRPSELRRISPYNGYNFGSKEEPNGFNASNSAIFVPKRNHPKYYYALNNMRNTVDFVKNQYNFEDDFKTHLEETGKSKLGNMIIHEFNDEVEKYGPKPKNLSQWGDLASSASQKPQESYLNSYKYNPNETVTIPYAYNTTKTISRKIPFVSNNIPFKEQRAKARFDRKHQDRDDGGWAAEWNSNQGDFQFWSRLTSNDWMKNIAKGQNPLQTGNLGYPSDKKGPRAFSSNLNQRDMYNDPLVANASQISRANRPESHQNDSHLQYDQSLRAPSSLKYVTPIASSNPSLLRTAGKTSTNISIEKNKKQLFENLENNNKILHDGGLQVQRAKSPGGVVQQEQRARPQSGHVQERQVIRRPMSAAVSRSSYSSKQENAINNSKLLLNYSAYQGPPYAKENFSGLKPKSDRFGTQYGQFFNYENTMYGNYKSARAAPKIGKKSNLSKPGVYW